MKPYISRLVSIYGIHWNIYHMLSSKAKKFIATKYQNTPRKTPNTLFGACFNLNTLGVKIATKYLHL